MSDPNSQPPNSQPQAQPQAAAAGDTGSQFNFVKLLYAKLLNFFPPGEGQYFALQFPTRYLDKASYAYDTSGIFSSFEKPMVVNEAEFRLTDDLFPTGPIVGGPNGQSLSVNFGKVLDSLIPAYEGSLARQQKELMRAWLLEPMDGDVPSEGDPNHPGTADSKPKPSRMQFSDERYNAYLAAKQAWDLKKDELIETAEASKDVAAMEKLTRQLAHENRAKNAELSVLYADAVVRGQLHTVRELLGHLDVRTTAEMLQDAKDSLRESAIGSLFTASTVYPVRMQPLDWFQALDTGFTPEDLSQSPGALEIAIEAKSAQIDSLESQIAALRGFQAGDVATLQGKVEAASQAQSDAMGALQAKYTENTISAVKLALMAAGAAVDPLTIVGDIPTEAAAELEAEKKRWAPKATKLKAYADQNPTQKTKLQKLLGDNYEQLDDIGVQMESVASATRNLSQFSRKLTEAMSAVALAKAGDTKLEVENLQRALTAARDEIQQMTTNYKIALEAAKVDPNVTKAADVARPPAANGGSRWIELTIDSKTKVSSQNSSSASHSAVSSTECNFWLGSYSHDTQTATGTKQADLSQTEVDISVSMRATYVTVDRSGWFDPSLAQMSGAFMHSAQGAEYQSWSKWAANLDKNGQSAASQLTKEIAAGTGETTNLTPGYLNAFPVGYILVKDCLIKATSSEFTDKEKRDTFHSGSQTAGGFLCFSTSSSSTDDQDSSHSATSLTVDGAVVRIPGPQILGYMMQLMPPDKSVDFVKMPDDYLFEPKPKKDHKSHTLVTSSAALTSHPEQEDVGAGPPGASDVASTKSMGGDQPAVSNTTAERDTATVKSDLKTFAIPAQNSVLHQAARTAVAHLQSGLAAESQ